MAQLDASPWAYVGGIQDIATAVQRSDAGELSPDPRYRGDARWLHCEQLVDDHGRGRELVVEAPRLKHGPILAHSHDGSDCVEVGVLQ
jgi:hypothetical protein